MISFFAKQRVVSQILFQNLQILAKQRVVSEKGIYQILASICCYWRLKENFLTALKVKHDVHWNPFFEGPKMVKATFAFEGGMKTQKSPSPYVWDHRVC